MSEASVALTAFCRRRGGWHHLCLFLQPLGAPPGVPHSESVVRAGDSEVCVDELERILEADSHSHLCPGNGVPAGARLEGLLAAIAKVHSGFL